MRTTPRYPVPFTPHPPEAVTASEDKAPAEGITAFLHGDLTKELYVE